MDARDGTLYDHWKDEKTLGSRAKFELDLNVPGLVIDPVLPADENLYRCRVDFKSSPTRNSRVRLKVIGKCSISINFKVRVILDEFFSLKYFNAKGWTIQQTF